MKKHLTILMITLVVFALGIWGVRLLQTPTTPSVQTTNDITTATTPSATTSSPSTGLQDTEEIISEPYTIQRGEVSLYGVITADTNYKQEKRPLIVMAHGFNNTLEMNEAYANHLARLGFVVYRFDFYGGSRQSKSGGTDMLSMSVLTEKADLEAVVAHLSQLDFVNSQSVNLLGVSQGGVVATLYAAEHPDSINQLILIFPAFVLFDDVRRTYQNLGVASPEQIPAIITHRNARLGAIYLQDALGIDIQAEISKVTASVLIIHGTNDNVVPYSYAQDANQRFQHSQLVTIQNGQHFLNEDFNQVALPAIDTFVRN